MTVQLLVLRAQGPCVPSDYAVVMDTRDLHLLRTCLQQLRTSLQQLPPGLLPKTLASMPTTSIHDGAVRLPTHSIEFTTMSRARATDCN